MIKGKFKSCELYSKETIYLFLELVTSTLTMIKEMSLLINLSKSCN